MKSIIDKETEEYKVEGIINRVIFFCIVRMEADLETKVHAAKSMLYKHYNIDISYNALFNRFERVHD